MAHPFQEVNFYAQSSPDTESVLDCALASLGMSADNESENDTGTDAPARLVTVNQVVAWNIAWYRHEEGLTQQELASRLGWPQNKVSEAERSWNGKRTREFDAETLAGLSVALGVPVGAFFLPPTDDGKPVRYVIRPPGQAEDLPAGELMAILVSYSDNDSNAAAGYRRRLLSATGRYLDPDWMAEVAAWLLPLTGAEAMIEGALRLRGGGADIRARADDSASFLDSLADAFENAAEEGE